MEFPNPIVDALKRIEECKKHLAELSDQHATRLLSATEFIDNSIACLESWKHEVAKIGDCMLSGYKMVDINGQES